MVISNEKLVIATPNKKEALLKIRDAKDRCVLLRVDHESEPQKIRQVTARYDEEQAGW